MRKSLLVLLGLILLPSASRAQDVAAPLDDWIRARFDQHMNHEETLGPGCWTFEADAVYLSPRLYSRGNMVSNTSLRIAPDTMAWAYSESVTTERSWQAGSMVMPVVAISHQDMTGNEWWADYRYFNASGGGASLHFHNLGAGFLNCTRDGRTLVGFYLGARGLVGGMTVPALPVPGRTERELGIGYQKQNNFIGYDIMGNPRYQEVEVPYFQPPVNESVTFYQSSEWKSWGVGPDLGMDFRLHFQDQGLTFFTRGRIAVVVASVNVEGRLFAPGGGVFKTQDEEVVALYPWFADVGVAWRPPVLPELELRVGYHLESLLNVDAKLLLLAQGAFAGIGWTY